VNVASKSTPLEDAAVSGVVNYAANGKIDLRKMAEAQAKSLDMDDEADGNMQEAPAPGALEE
jgi:hypothetical protein